MELLRYTSPFDAAEVLALWKDIFGESEARLETPQVDGSEQEQNLDIVYVAREGEELLGTIHATIPRACPAFGGISAMCTTPAARGKGIGRILFTAIVEELDRLGVRYQFLGTGNYIAAKLYHSLGFSFLPCSSVMARFTEGDLVDFNRMMFDSEAGACHIEKGSAAMRIPIIPLILHKGPFVMLDCNTDLINCAHMPQICCMSLYPRYMDLETKGGAFWGVRNEKGILGAVASVLPTDLGLRADFYCAGHFRQAVPALLAHCEEIGPVYLQIAASDTAKKELAEAAGFHPADEILLSRNGFRLPCVIYRK